MLTTLLSKSLTVKKTIHLNSNLVATHAGADHPIFLIPKNYTLLDALSYVFDDDAGTIANVLQDYVDEVPRAIELMHGIQKGIKSKTICLTCIKGNINLMMK